MEMMATSNGLTSKDHLGHGRSEVHDVLEVPVCPDQTSEPRNH